MSNCWRIQKFNIFCQNVIVCSTEHLQIVHVSAIWHQIMFSDHIWRLMVKLLFWSWLSFIFWNSAFADWYFRDSAAQINFPQIPHHAKFWINQLEFNHWFTIIRQILASFKIDVRRVLLYILTTQSSSNAEHYIVFTLISKNSENSENSQNS